MVILKEGCEKDFGSWFRGYIGQHLVEILLSGGHQVLDAITVGMMRHSLLQK